MKTLNWTSEQEKIFKEFETGKSHFRVTARAGTGKTTTIKEGLNHAKEEKILYLVFNKKLQLEAEQKITNQKVSVKTLHSLGYSYIARNWRKFKAGASTEFFRVKSECPEMPPFVMFQTAKLVSYLKNTVIIPTLKDAMEQADLRGIDGGAFENEGWTVDRIAEVALKVIEKSKEYSFNISFDDMVYLPVALNWVKPEYDLVVIDEAQDMNLPQLTMATQACKQSGRICLVGDDRQAIYGFRGALPDGMDIFKEKLKTKEFALTVTYRCPKKVVQFAQAIVPDIRAADNAIEGELNLINEDLFLSGVRVKDAVLSRTNAPLMKQCLALLRKNIPSYCEGRDIGKTLIDLIQNLGGKTVSEFLINLEAWQGVQTAKATGKYAASKLDLVNDKVETLRCLSETVITIADLESKINSLFKDKDDVKIPSVVCSTVHRFKGLEVENSFLLMDTFQSKRRGLTPDEIKEESNIFYVGVTRCRKALNLVSLDTKVKKPVANSVSK